MEELQVSYGLRGGQASFLVIPSRDCATVDLHMYCPADVFASPSAFIADLAVSTEITEAERVALGPMGRTH